MPFVYSRTVRFSDTDAAGVVYFASALSICHEAYEASLAAVGVDLRSFFAGEIGAVPIVHAEMDFFKPLFCGDCVEVHLTPTALTENEFEVAYRLALAGSVDRLVSRALTRNVCIDPATRRRIPLPDVLIQWHQQWSASDR